VPNPLKILVIEDMDADFLLLERNLRRQGLNIQCRRIDSNIALDQALNEKWDIVLSDYNVPGMDLRASLHRINESVPDLPVILVSGSVGEEVAVELLKLGLTDFILKDRLARLPESIRRALKEVEERTKRLDAEIALKESEEKFRSFFENAPTSSLAINPYTGQIVQANLIALKMWGYTAEEIVTKSISDLTHPDDLEMTKTLSINVAKGLNSNIRIEKRYLKKDGSTFWGDISIASIRDSQGKVKLGIGSILDITERKTSELALLENRVAFETTHDGFWIVDAAGILKQVNKAYADMSGYSIDELLGMHVSKLEFNEKTIDDVKAHITKIVETGYDTFETRHIHKDGHLFDPEVSTTFIPQTKQFVTFLHDITNRKLADEALRSSNSKLESALASMSDAVFISDTQGRFIEFNDAFATFHKFKTKEECAKTLSEYPEILEVYSPGGELLPLEDWAVSRALRGETVSNAEFTLRRKDTGETWVGSYNFAPIRNKAGEIDGSVVTARDITELKENEKKIEYLAYYDFLTALPNRRLLHDRLERALISSLRQGRFGSLLFIDLDNFKTINDTLGHDIGDKLLQEAALRILNCVREGDTVSRSGGDEFVVMLCNLSFDKLEAASQTESVGNKILRSLMQPYLLAGGESYTTSSIGATLFGDEKLAIEEIQRQADIAMYQSKKAGRNTLRFFGPEMQESISSQAKLEEEIRFAIDHQEFELYFQIQVDTTGRPIGAEALIRWNSPKRGLVPPGNFIPLAEDTGLILPIGNWVIKSACAQIKIWQNNPKTSHLVISINVSAKQIQRDDFVDQVIACIKEYEIDPKLLKIEITESMLLDSIEHTIATMYALKREGILFSLDDFGTGYSSLQYLKKLPLDQLKIDQSFVNDLADDSSDRAIVRTIIAMANSLDLDVIAEGVETEEQRQLLFNIGCLTFQGYLFGKPIRIKEFEALISTHLSSQR